MQLLKIDLPVPDYSTLCRRLPKLSVKLQTKFSEGSVHVVVDGTGLKVFGEGEWKVRQHGYSKRRTWMKLHYAVDSSEDRAILKKHEEGENRPLLARLQTQAVDIIDII